MEPSWSKPSCDCKNYKNWCSLSHMSFAVDVDEYKCESSEQIIFLKFSASLTFFREEAEAGGFHNRSLFKNIYIFSFLLLFRQHLRDVQEMSVCSCCPGTPWPVHDVLCESLLEGTDVWKPFGTLLLCLTCSWSENKSMGRKCISCLNECKRELSAQFINSTFSRNLLVFGPKRSRVNQQKDVYYDK